MKFFDPDSVSINLILLRKDLDLTQEEVAKKAGISRATLSHIECGSHNVTVTTIYKILSVYGGGTQLAAKVHEVVDIDDRYIPEDFLDGAAPLSTRWKSLVDMIGLFGRRCLVKQ